MRMGFYQLPVASAKSLLGLANLTTQRAETAHLRVYEVSYLRDASIIILGMRYVRCVSYGTFAVS